MSKAGVLEFVPEQMWVPLDEPTPVVYGLENEYGVSIWPTDYKRSANRPPDFSDEDWDMVLRKNQPEHMISTSDLYWLLQQYLPEGIELADSYLTNGARFYNDHFHPEYATPECRSIRELLLAHAAGEMVVRETFENAKQDGYFKNYLLTSKLIDGKGQSFGFHENYLMSREVNPTNPHVYRPLAAHFAARQVFGGAYCQENGWFSQRAQYFEEVAGDETTRKRPIINLRDEPHAEYSKYRRLHVINGDATQLPMATALRVGMANIVNRLISHGVDLSHLYFPIGAAPVAAFQKFGADTTFSATVRMANGTYMSALDIEEEFVTLARRLSETADVFTDEELQVMEWMETFIDRLRENPSMETIQYISDGAMKRVLIDRNPERAVRTDLQYGLLDPAGLAWKIRERGACEPAFGFSMDAAREYMRKAPEGRAAKRAKVIRSLVEWGVYRLDRHSTYEHVGANSTITGVRKNIILRDVTGETPTDEQLDVRLRRLHRALFASADVSMSEADRYEDIY